MAITATYINYALPGGTSAANRPTGAYLRYICDVEADLPTVNVVDGDLAFTEDVDRRWLRAGGAWVLQTNDVIAAFLVTTSQVPALPIGALADGQFLKRVGNDIVGATPASGVAWGGITGTLSAQTDLQTALDAKLATAGNGSALTGLTKTQVGLANADNTSDAAKPVSTATQTALDAKQATLVSGTNIKTINGATVLGSGDLAVSAADPSYTPGSFTVATGTGRLVIKRLQLTTTQRATLTGTARLKAA